VLIHTSFFFTRKINNALLERQTPTTSNEAA